MAKRSPKGVVTRSYPDWRYQQMAVGSVAAGSPSGPGGVVGLYNNATDGSYLFVYALLIDNSANSVAARLGTIQSSVGAQPYETPVSILAGAPLPPGIQVGYVTDIALEIASYAVAKAGEIRMLAPGWPLVVLPPTWALVINNGLNDTELTLTSWWLAMQEVT